LTHVETSLHLASGDFKVTIAAFGIAALPGSVVSAVSSSADYTVS